MPFNRTRIIQDKEFSFEGKMTPNELLLSAAWLLDELAGLYRSKNVALADRAWAIAEELRSAAAAPTTTPDNQEAPPHDAALECYSEQERELKDY